MITTLLIIGLLLIGSLLFFLYKSSAQKQKQRKKYLSDFLPSWETILKEKVSYYNQLSPEDQERFKKKIQQFLSEATISGVNVDVDDSIRLLIASSAVIPVFRLDDWQYLNMGEILVYNGEVDTGETSEYDKETILLGQVRPFQTKHMVLFSKQYLEQGFQQMKDGHNVGMHEFAHMIDQADGDIDGIPSSIMPPELIKPWTKIMYAELEKMKKGKSDINVYGYTNHAEFFAVVCEYFFENPEKFKKKHPEMYRILTATFFKKK